VTGFDEVMSLYMSASCAIWITTLIFSRTYNCQ